MEYINRRHFLAQSIRGAAGVSLGMATWSLAADNVLGANNKVVLALIGAGNRGCTVFKRMVEENKNVEAKYICDVDDTRGGAIISELEKIQGYAPKRVIDMREVFDDKDVDGVVIATPEHWHALATVWACQAGKDVFVEKNISMNMWESRKMLEAARKYNRIVDSGAQNRSAPYGLTARQYIKDGKLGKVLHVKVFNMLLEGGKWNPPADSDAPPAGLDWDRWLGPAPERKYNPYIHKRWSDCWAYGTGELGHGASHQLDMARMVLGDPEHPKSVYAAGGRMSNDDKRDTPDLQVITYDYGKYIMTMDMACFTPYLNKEGADVRLSEKFPDWKRNSTRIEIYGTEAMMYVGRMGGGWQVFAAKGKDKKEKIAELVDQDPGYLPDKWHEANFIDCIRSRKLPNGDIEQSHYSTALVHMGNFSTRVGGKHLVFDTKEEKFTNSDEANKLLKLEYRSKYSLSETV